jgi:hypothetical protein
MAPTNGPFSIVDPLTYTVDALRNLTVKAPELKEFGRT